MFHKLILIVCVLLLGACAANQNRPEVGSFEWFQLVEQKYPSSDGHGHGPDYGSQEWCEVIYFKMHGERSKQTVACDKAWFEEVDRQI